MSKNILLINNQRVEGWMMTFVGLPPCYLAAKIFSKWACDLVNKSIISFDLYYSVVMFPIVSAITRTLVLSSKIWAYKSMIVASFSSWESVSEVF